MSTYLQARDALLTLCRAYGDGAVFTEENSACNDYTKLDGGARALIIVRGAPSVEGEEIDGVGSHGEIQEKHTFFVWVFTAVGVGDGGYGAIVDENEQLVEGLRDFLRPYERLDDAVNLMRLSETDVPQLNNAESHVMQRFTVTCWCETAYDPIEVGG